MLERIAAFKERMKQKRQARAQKRSKPVPLPPVYDAVFEAGTRLLDGEPISPELKAAAEAARPVSGEEVSTNLLWQVGEVQDA